MNILIKSNANCYYYALNQIILIEIKINLIEILETFKLLYD
jgi:hypothetical protein